MNSEANDSAIFPKILNVKFQPCKRKPSQHCMTVSENGYKYKMTTTLKFKGFHPNCIDAIQNNHSFYCSRRRSTKCPYSFCARFLGDQLTKNSNQNPEFEELLDLKKWEILSTSNVHTCIPVGTDDFEENMKELPRFHLKKTSEIINPIKIENERDKDDDVDNFFIENDHPNTNQSEPAEISVLSLEKPDVNDSLEMKYLKGALMIAGRPKMCYVCKVVYPPKSKNERVETKFCCVSCEKPICLKKHAQVVCLECLNA